jgi:two-component system, LytTR family, response regulator
MNEKMYKIVIVDDDRVALENIEWEIKRQSDMEVVGTAINGIKGRKTILTAKPDLLFLDVEMPDTTGVDLLKNLKEKIDWNLKVVFYTAYDRYLLQALRESAFDYLLKPFDPVELHGIFDRFREDMNRSSKSNVSNLNLLISKITQNAGGGVHDSFMVVTANGYRMLHISEIGYFEYNAEQRQWEIMLFDQTMIKLKRSTSAEDVQKYSDCFFRINQTIIININYLSHINGRGCYLYPPFENREDFVISRNYLKKIQDRFFVM